MPIQAILFDLGGVIVRTEDYTRRDQLAARLGLTREGLEQLVFTEGTGAQCQRGEVSAARHWESLGRRLKLTPEEVPAFQRDFWGGDQVDYALLDYIRALRPRYRTGLLSNAFTDLRDTIRDIWRFEDAFDELIISSEVGFTKPDPRIYRLALERLDAAPEEAVFVDDFQHNVVGARAVGMHAIQFHSPQQVVAELEHLLASDGK